VTWSVAAALAPGEPDAAAGGVAPVPAEGEAAPAGAGVLPHGSTVAAGPGEPDAADAAAPAPAEGEAAPEGGNWGVGEDAEEPLPHPSTRIATAIANRRKPRKLALERRLIESPIG
jgi:hypothetical protein